ncbi:MAG: peptide deformylase [Hydrotalea sp.]|nr:peptide deformylase [Hydrotalea sp.]
MTQQRKPHPRDILILPDKLLRERSKEIPRVSDETRQIFDDMVETMKSANGIGLAAPQVGILQKLVVIDFRYSTRYPRDDLTAAEQALEDSAPPIIDVTDDADDDDDDDDDASPPTLFLANPEIIYRSDETNVYQEGCLSIPQVFEDVTRPKQVKVRYWDYYGKEQEISADGLLATCLQHEWDHLHGKLFIDYLSPLKKSMIVKKFTKLAKQKES